MMKKLIILLFIFLGFFSNSQTTITTWNLPAYTGNPHGIRFWTDVASNQTRYFTYDLIEAGMIGDSAFASRNALNKVRDSVFGVLNALITTNTANIATNTANITTNTSNIATNTASILTKLNISDTAAMLAAYTRNGSGVVFFYDSTQFKNLGTGISPFRMTNTITGGSCSNCNLTYDSTGRIFTASSAAGGVGPFLYLPTQSSGTALPVPNGMNLFDSAGLNFVRSQDQFRRRFASTLTANRVYTLPDNSLTFAGIDINNNFTSAQTITNTVGPQFTLAYDGTHSMTISVSSTGTPTISTTTSTITVPNISTSNITLANNATLTSSGSAVWSLGASTGRFTLPSTITAAGTTTSQTINKITGSVNIAAGSSSVVVTNSTVQGTSSLVYLQVYGNDATAKSATVSAVSAGSFTIQLNANATAETKIGFLVIN